MEKKIVSVMAQMMAKTLEHRGKNTRKVVTMFAETLCRGVEMANSTKRKWSNRGIEPEGKNLIEDNFHLVDDWHTIENWTIRNLLRPINGNPNT